MVGHIYFSTLFSFEACEDFRRLLRCPWHTRGPSSFIPLLLQGRFPPPSFRTHPGADTKHWDPPTNSGMCTPHGEMPIYRCTGNYTSIARNFLQFGVVHYNATVLKLCKEPSRMRINPNCRIYKYDPCHGWWWRNKNISPFNDSESITEDQDTQIDRPSICHIVLMSSPLQPFKFFITDDAEPV